MTTINQNIKVSNKEIYVKPDGNIYSYNEVALHARVANKTGHTEFRVTFVKNEFVSAAADIYIIQMSDKIVKLRMTVDVEGSAMAGNEVYLNPDRALLIEFNGSVPTMKALTVPYKETFKDLYDFIQTADRDESGYYKWDRSRALHIYDGRHQVNICHDPMGSGDYMPIRNIVFDGDEVRLYKVNYNGVCDYDHPITCNIDDHMDSYLHGTAMIIVNACINNWEDKELPT